MKLTSEDQIITASTPLEQATNIRNRATSASTDLTRQIMPQIVLAGRQLPRGVIPPQIQPPQLGVVSREGQGFFQIPQTNNAVLSMQS